MNFDSIPFIPSKSKEGYPFVPEIKTWLETIVKDLNPSKKWREAYVLERGDECFPQDYPISPDQMTLGSSTWLRGHGYDSTAIYVPLVLHFKRLPCPLNDLGTTYNPHEMVARVEAMEEAKDSIGCDTNNPVYRGAIMAKLMEILGLRSVLPWPLVLRRPEHKVVRGERDFCYYLATLVEGSHGSVLSLAKDGWFGDDSHVLSFLLQILVPLVVAWVAGVSVVHNHLTLDVIRYKKTNLAKMSFWLDDDQIDIDTSGYRFYVEGWDYYGSVNPHKDVMALAFSLEPWIGSSSTLKPFFDHWCNPVVRRQSLSLDKRYNQTQKSLLKLLDFLPDDPEVYCPHAAVDCLVQFIP